MGKKNTSNKYTKLIEEIFHNHYYDGCTQFEFRRDEIEQAAKKLKISLPKNIGDVLYSFRFRVPLPESIAVTEPEGLEWVIELSGRAIYKFRLSKINRVVPSELAYQIKIPDATPEIINMYAKGDEQALLAKVRYNRLIDIFLGVAAFSLQNHLRTTVPGIGQIEVDELYVGVRDTGQQFIIPVQAKGGSDQIAAPQVQQDLMLCRHAFSSLTPRLIAVQFMDTDIIAMFELVFQDDELRVVREKHYCLVPAGSITDDDLQTMATLED